MSPYVTPSEVITHDTTELYVADRRAEYVRTRESLSNDRWPPVAVSVVTCWRRYLRRVDCGLH